ncbi:MAG: helix-turn-helix transcriptional regulator [Bacteroidota bacterium]
MHRSTFHGKKIYEQVTDGFRISETHYTSNQTIEFHAHENPSIIILLEGSFTENYLNKSFEHSQTNIIYRPAFEKHSNHFHRAGAKCLNLELLPNLQKTNYQPGLLANQPFAIKGNPFSSIIAKIKNEIKINDAFSKLVLEGLTMEMTAQILRSNSKNNKTMPERLKYIVDYINSSKDFNFSYIHLAGLIDVHPVYLHKSFKKYVHSTIGEYLRQRKISAVCKEVFNTNKSFGEIALEYGFSDQSHFNKLFKKYTGFTPSQYRFLHKNPLKTNEIQKE